MEEHPQDNQLSIKICRDCSRVNQPDEVYCQGCGGDSFDDLHFTPFWDSLDEYVQL